MAVEKFISARTLAKYLQQEIEALLVRHQLYDIGHYGWLDGDTPDPEFLGHAMWKVESPVLNDMLNVGFPDISVTHRPTEEEEALVVSGSDFEGQVRLARMSVGLALWQQALAQELVFDDNDYFWLHYASGMVMLNAASDRIREFFIMAFFRQKINVYENKDAKEEWKRKPKSWYVTPFIHARDLEARDSGEQLIEQLLEKLVSLAQDVFSYRRDRNRIIHEISTRIGTRNRLLMHQLRQRFHKQQGSNSAPQISEISDPAARFKEVQDLHGDELYKATDQIVSWYKTLIQASSLVFEVENRIRRRKAGARTIPI
jgi:hypothetical protein